MRFNSEVEMNKTKIEWCDRTWNPVTGCEYGCPYCYARKIAQRFPIFNKFKPTFHEKRLQRPLKIKEPQVVFVSSMGDLFGPWVPSPWISRILNICEQAHWHRFIFLTKNPARYNNWEFPPNCIAGFTAVNHEDYYNKMSKLYSPTAERLNLMVSLEPLQGPVIPGSHNLAKYLKWIIIGAETGNRKNRIRPYNPWVINIIRNSDERLNIPIFVKDSLPGFIRREYPEIIIDIKI